MPTPANLGGLNSGDFSKLTAAADALEQAWKDGKTVELGQFLPPVGNPSRSTFLLELIKTDLECRWKHGQEKLLDYYVDKFPELGSVEALPATLVLEEFRIRQLFGDRVTLDAYKSRFPNQFPEVERLAASQISGDTAYTSANVAPTPPTPSAPTKPKVSAAGFAKGHVLDNGYKLLERIGSGGFAEVWKGEAPGGVHCAMKIIVRPFDQEEAQRERQSLELVKNLRHHFLLSVHTFDQMQDRLMIAMDLADGSLRDRLNRCRKEGKDGIPLPELLKYMRQSAEALDYLHFKKVQHRDIKPENILLVEGNVRVADFGLAKGHGTIGGLAQGTFAGTPHYMPPEVWQEENHLHGDQYSLAASYFELRVGRRLHKASGLPALMRAVLHDSLQLDPLEPQVQEVLRKALARNPEERYPSCLAFVDALQQAEAPPAPAASEDDDAPPALGTIIPGKGTRPSWRADTQPEPSAASTFVPVPASWLWPAVAVAAFLGLGAVLVLVVNRPGPGSGKFALDAPAAQKVYIGEQAQLDVHIKRENFTEPVQVKLIKDGATLAEKTIPPDASSVPVQLPVRIDALPGLWKIKITASAGTDTHEQPFDLSVIHLPTLPEPSEAGTFRAGTGTTIVPLASTKKKYYKDIECMVDGTPVRFILIPALREHKAQGQVFVPRPYYIMVDKVCNGLFAKAPGSQAAAILNKPAEWPVLGQDYDAAAKFARWLGGAHASLPSADQWDTAAGRWEDGNGEGPFRGPFEELEPDDVKLGRKDIALSRKEPLPVGTAPKDVSLSGCRDMAGNGMEWTRTYHVLKEAPKEVEGTGAEVPREAHALLRGRDFHEDEPLRWRNYNMPDVIPFHNAERANGHKGPQLSRIGFRVVIEAAGE